MRFVDMEREYILRLLIQCEGDVKVMERVSELNKRTLYRKMNSYHLRNDLLLARATRKGKVLKSEIQ